MFIILYEDSQEDQLLKVYKEWFYWENKEMKLITLYEYPLFDTKELLELIDYLLKKYQNYAIEFFLENTSICSSDNSYDEFFINEFYKNLINFLELNDSSKCFLKNKSLRQYIIHLEPESPLSLDLKVLNIGKNITSDSEFYYNVFLNSNSNMKPNSLIFKDLSFDIKLNISKKETQAQLRIFLSNCLSDRICVLPLKSSKKKSNYTISEIIYPLNENKNSENIFDSTYMIFYLFTKIKTDNGLKSVFNITGYGILSFYDLFEKLKNPSYSLNINLTYLTNIPIQKGLIQINSIKKIDMNLQNEDTYLSKQHTNLKSSENIIKILSKPSEIYLSKISKDFERYMPTFNYINKIRSYLYGGHIGGHIPSSMFFNLGSFSQFLYFDYEKETFFNMFLISMRRCSDKNLNSVNDFSENIKGTSNDLLIKTLSNILSTLLTLYCNYCEYLTDQIIDSDTNDIIQTEFFSNPTITGAADCEDFSKFMVELYCSILNIREKLYSNEYPSTSSIVDKIIFNLSEICLQYIPFVVLCGAKNGSLSKFISNNDISINDGDIKNEFKNLERISEISAHEFVFLMPKWYCVNIINIRKLNAENQNIVLSEMNYFEKNWIPYIKPKILEGTGALIPYHLNNDDFLDFNKSPISQELPPLMDNIKKKCFKINDFYKVMMTCWTPVFVLKGCECLEWNFYMIKNIKTKKTSKESKLSRIYENFNSLNSKKTKKTYGVPFFLVYDTIDNQRIFDVLNSKIELEAQFTINKSDFELFTKMNSIKYPTHVPLPPKQEKQILNVNLLEKIQELFKKNYSKYETQTSKSTRILFDYDSIELNQSQFERDLLFLIDKYDNENSDFDLLILLENVSMNYDLSKLFGGLAMFFFVKNK